MRESLCESPLNVTIARAFQIRNGCGSRVEAGA